MIFKLLLGRDGLRRNAWALNGPLNPSRDCIHGINAAARRRGRIFLLFLCYGIDKFLLVICREIASGVDSRDDIIESHTLAHSVRGRRKEPLQGCSDQTTDLEKEPLISGAWLV